MESMKGILVGGIACCLFLGLLIFALWARPYELLTDGEIATLFGGDEFDDYAICDGVSNCTACVAPICTTGPLYCLAAQEGVDGCANATGTDSYCSSFSLWSDCEYKGGVQVCGGPSNSRLCSDMVNYPTCNSWGAGKAGCEAATYSIEECQNCATIP
jgi:hypothetical protein